MPEKSYQYSPIDPSVDGIRLLIVEPAESVWGTPKDLSAPISCRIQHVTFGQKPKYEALSYTWGDESIRHTISIDGSDFSVGQNLFDALRVLRDDAEERTLWIDAICINQTDIPERNKQISIMPFIYMRAKTVLIWLGLQMGSWVWEVEDVPEITASDTNYDRNTYDLLYSLLAENPYWKRVWIIQEVGLARRRVVYYSTHQVEWSTLIGKLQGNQDTEDSLPVRLQKQLDVRYHNSHNLQFLIENHRDSLCKEARDHIYGFVGLAVDCEEGFPMGYEKSLYEVWKDVIRFKNTNQTYDDLRNPESRPNFDILSFGRIVQELLGGPGIASAEEVARDITSPVKGFQNDGENKGGTLQRAEIFISGLCSGRIVHLGPTYEELMSDLKAMASWRASMNHYLFAREQPSAREESDLFLELLEDAGDEDMKNIETFDRDIWSPIPDKLFCLEDVDSRCRDFESEDTAHNDSEQELTEPRLFLLGGGSKTYGGNSGSKLGLAPPTTRVGDYIVLVHGIEKVLVVRKERGRILLIGTAAPARDLYTARELRKKDTGMEKVFVTNAIKDFRSLNWLDMYVDIATMYQLMG